MPFLRNRIRSIAKKFSKFKKGIGFFVMALSAFSMRNNPGFLPAQIQVIFYPKTMEKDGEVCTGQCKELKKDVDANDVSGYQEHTGVILDLEELVKRRAHYFYKAQQKSFFKRKPVIVVDWSDVKFCPEKVTYIPLDDGEDVFRVTSKMIFENMTSIDQRHDLKADRQTSSECNSSLTEGYTKGPTIGLSLPVPLETGILTKFTLKHVKRNNDQENSTSHVENHIKVPRQSIVAVSTLTNQKKTRYFFTTFIKVQGNAKAIFYNQKEQKIGFFEIPMGAIIVEEFPERMTRNDNSIKIKGTCEFNYVVDKNVVTPSPGNINDRSLSNIYSLLSLSLGLGFGTFCMYVLN